RRRTACRGWRARGGEKPSGPAPVAAGIGAVAVADSRERAAGGVGGSTGNAGETARSHIVDSADHARIEARRLIAAAAADKCGLAGCGVVVAAADRRLH